MDRNEFTELVYETFADEPDNVLANGIIEAADAYAEHEKAQLSQECTTKDTISRQAALEKVRAMQTYKLFKNDDMLLVDKAEVQTELMMLPSVQPEVLACGNGELVAQPEPKDIDAREAVYNLAEKIGIHQLFALTVELRGEPIQPKPQWIPVNERLPSKEERKEWIDNNLDGIGYLYPCLVTRYSSINPDRTKNNPYVAKHYFDGEDFLNAGEEVCSEYIIAWMPLPEAYKPNNK